jgi:hypothetical protein
LFQEELDRAKSEEYMECFSLIDFAVNGCACVSASSAYPDNPALQD